MVSLRSTSGGKPADQALVLVSFSLYIAILLLLRITTPELHTTTALTSHEELHTYLFLRLDHHHSMQCQHVHEEESF